MQQDDDVMNPPPAVPPPHEGMGFPVIAPDDGDASSFADIRAIPVPAGLLVEEVEPGQWRIAEKKAPTFWRILPHLMPLLLLLGIEVNLCRLYFHVEIDLTFAVLFVGIAWFFYAKYVIGLRTPQVIKVDARGIAVRGEGRGRDMFIRTIADVQARKSLYFRNWKGTVLIQAETVDQVMFYGRPRGDVEYAAYLISRVLQSHGWNPPAIFQ